jgi:uncharacterized alpha-E superfamily protein
MTTCYTISVTKANRLYWLGRYAERGYLTLHLLRKEHDRIIDGNRTNEKDFTEKLYDNVNYSGSLLASLESANDNAIVLREEIKSESLSYIQLSLVLIKECAEKGEHNITALQPITDHLLAFFGSIDARMLDLRLRNILKTGKLVEFIDLSIRHDYPFEHIRKGYQFLLDCRKQCDSSLFDTMHLTIFEEMLRRDLYENQQGDYKKKLLQHLNDIVLV